MAAGGVGAVHRQDPAGGRLKVKGLLECLFTTWSEWSSIAKLEGREGTEGRCQRWGTWGICGLGNGSDVG